MSGWETVSKSNDGWEDVGGWETVSPEKDKKTSLENPLIGAGEATLSTLTGLTSGSVGGMIGGAQGILDTVRSGTFGTQEGVKQAGEKFHEYADMATYSPRTAVGKEYSGKVGQVINDALLPLVSAAPQLEALAHLAKPAMRQAVGGKAVENIPVPTIDKTDPSIKAPGHVPSTGELTMLNRVYQSSLDKIANIEKMMTEVNDEIAKTPDDVPQHLLDTFKELEDQHRKTSAKATELENILSDPTQIPESHYTENKIVRDDLMNQIKARRKASRGPHQPDQEVTLEDQAKMYPEDERGQNSDPNSHTVEVGGNDPHTITYTVGSDGRVTRKVVYPDGTTFEEFLTHTKDGDEVWVSKEGYEKGEYYPQQFTKDQLTTWLAEEHPNTPPSNTPKMSPVEVAVSRIGEAMSMPKERLVARLQKARNALDSLSERVAVDESPGSSYSSLKAAIEQEIKAYEALLRGEKPDLSWFEGKQEQTSTVPYTEPVFRTPEQAQEAAIKNKTEALSQGEALRKTERETREILTERERLIDKENKSLLDDLRIAELDDQYNEILVRNDPKNEFKDVLESYREELADLHEFASEMGAEYVAKRKPIVEDLISKYQEVQRQMENPKPVDKSVGPERFEALEELDRQATSPDNGLPPIEAYANEPVLTPWQQRQRGETPPAPRSAAQQLQHHQFQFNKLSRILDNVNKQIKNYDEGKTPSGTFDIAKAQQMRESLERQIAMHQEGIAKVLDVNPKLREKLNKLVGETKAEPHPVPENKYVSMKELTEATGENVVEAVRALDANPSLVNTIPGTKISFDVNLPQKFQKIMTHLIKLTKFADEKVYFVLAENFPAAGRVMHAGNTTYIRLHPSNIAKNLADLSGKKFFNKLTGGKLTEALEHLNTVRYAAHELGHAILNKYLRDSVTHTDDLMVLTKQWEEFNKKAKHTANSIFDMGKEKQRADYQKAFHEFFAEKVARELMHKHVISAFDKRSKGMLSDIKNVVDASHKYLKDTFGFEQPKPDFADTILSDILNGSTEYIASTSRQAADRVKIIGNDKLILGEKAADRDAFPFYQKTLQDTREVLGALDGITSIKKTVADDAPMNGSYQPGLSRRAVEAISSSFVGATTKLFGKTGVAQIFKDNPIIQDVYWKIRNAEITSARIANNIWFGDVGRKVWDESNFFAKLSKIKDKSSPYMIVKTSKPEDMAAVHDVLKKGLEEGLEYHETLDKYGTGLSIEQQGIFKTLTGMFTKQYEAMVKEQEKMGKKNILPRRKGWYPSVRKGDYYVDINFQGTSAYRQHFTTKAEGEAFLEKLGSGNLKHLSATGVEKIKLEDSNPFLDSIDTFKDFLEKKYPSAGGVLKKDIEGLVEALVTRGGKLGKHHNYRSNLEGYKGSEIFASAKERGNSFKEAIQNSVNDYTGTLRKMQINHSVEPIIRNGAETMHPDTLAVIQQMSDSALNKVENKMAVLDDSVRNWVDSAAKTLYDVAGKEFKPGDPVFDKIKNGMLETFYLTKLMAKPVFAVGQVISTPVQAIRHMAYDGGLRAYMSFGKGLFKLAINDKELKDSIFKVSQETNTFEPQFIEALHLNKNDSSLLEGIKKYVFLNKINEGADSLSRVMTYASMYEHYKSLGKTKAEAEQLAMHGTDTTMVQYGRSEQAPMFQHAGIMGEMARPLQTFGQAQFANLVGDIKHFKTLQPKTWAPLLTYGLTATMVGGVLAPAFITEYEIIRKWLNAQYPEYSIPSVLDLVAHDDSMIDRIIPDNDLVRKTIEYGLPSLSGIDLSSSVRANENFTTLLGSVLLAEESWTRMFPLIQVTADTVSGGSVLISEALGKKHTDADLSKAVNKALPVGPIAYGAKELLGVNETNIMGKQTGMMPLGNTGMAEKPRQPVDIVAGLMGTRSTDDRFETQKALNRTEIDKNRQTQIKRLADLAIETGDPKYIEKIVSYGVDSKTLENMIGSEVWSRLADVETRYLVNSKGKAPANYETARKANLLNKFRSSQ